MLELVDTTMLTLEVKEKEQAPLGQRIHAVGMCFYKKGTLRKGITTSCIEIATIPKTQTVLTFGASISQRQKRQKSSRMYKIVISMPKIFK